MPKFLADSADPASIPPSSIVLENATIDSPKDFICSPNLPKSLLPAKKSITTPVGSICVCNSAITDPALAAACIAVSFIAPSADTVSEKDTIASPKAVNCSPNLPKSLSPVNLCNHPSIGSIAC